MKHIWFNAGAIVIVAAAIGIVAWQVWPREIANAAPLAECLASKGVTMYGAAWCPHCQNQKLAFGASFSMVPYVECPEHIELCKAKGIEGYPTWILPGGTRLVGEQSLPKIAEASGCPFSAATNQ